MGTGLGLIWITEVFLDVGAKISFFWEANHVGHSKTNLLCKKMFSTQRLHSNTRMENREEK